MSGCTWIEAQRGNREWWGVVQISEWETLSAPTDGCQVGLALLDFSVFPKTQEIWIFMGGTFQYLNIIFFLNMMWADILWAKQNTCMDVRPAKALNQITWPWNHLIKITVINLPYTYLLPTEFKAFMQLPAWEKWSGVFATMGFGITHPSSESQLCHLWAVCHWAIFLSPVHKMGIFPNFLGCYDKWHNALTVQGQLIFEDSP